MLGPTSAVPAPGARILLVDLGRFRDPELRILTGREPGHAARAATRLDQLDRSPDVDRVVIQVPEDTWDVGSGFWLAMFGDSVRRLGGEGFRARYAFRGGIAPEDVEAGIEEALAAAEPLPVSVARNVDGGSAPAGPT